MNITPELIKDALSKPGDFGWFGRDDMFVTWGMCGPVKTRDSGPLDISNHDFILADLTERFPGEVESIECSHWAHGWIAQICVHVSDDGETPTPVFEALMDWREELSHNPIADEDHADQILAAMDAEYE